jgi:hypothetical protein
LTDETDTESVTWRTRAPARAALRLAWTSFLAVVVCGLASLLFGNEPEFQADGSRNPLVLVVPVLVIGFTIVLIAHGLALFRRPVVRTDRYALSVRPGVVRTLVMAWAEIAELTLVDLDDETYLLIRCAPVPVPSADRPRWWDQGQLRAVRRALPEVSAYDLAVPLGEFAGSPETLIARLGTAAPPHVGLFDRGGEADET